MRMHKNTTETEGEKKRGNEINGMHLSAFTSTQTYLNLISHQKASLIIQATPPI